MDFFEIMLSKMWFVESSIVIFYVRDMLVVSELKLLLKSRFMFQCWVYVLWESLMVIFNLLVLNGLFNLIWIYRIDLDFWVLYGYYELYCEEDGKMNEVVIMIDYIEGKLEFVVWMVGNCFF